jgi:hypothetical protein
MRAHTHTHISPTSLGILYNTFIHRSPSYFYLYIIKNPIPLVKTKNTTSSYKYYYYFINPIHFRYLEFLSYEDISVF